MIKVLILCKKNETTKFLINSIISEISSLHLIGLANTIEEASKLLTKTTPNLIITSDSNIFSLFGKNSKDYLPRIILVTKEPLKVPYRYSFVLKYDLDKQTMIKKINKFINDYLYVSKKEELTKILTEIGFSFKLSGTLYLLEAILYANVYKDSYSYEKLEKDIYSYVAKKHKSTAQRIKWSVERSVRYWHESLTKESYINIEKYLSVEYPKKPTPKLIVNSLSNIISL